MADKLSREHRSANMAAIKSKNTGPELVVRKLLHRLGYAYRIHCKHLPGKPDVVFPGRRKVIFVHGCFWHQHPVAECLDARKPKSNADYWVPKLERNVQRDAELRLQLEAAGWDVLIIWDCQTKDEAPLTQILTSFLGPGRHSRV